MQGIDALVAVIMFPMLNFNDLQAVKYLRANREFDLKRPCQP